MVTNMNQICIKKCVLCALSAREGGRENDHQNAMIIDISDGRLLDDRDREMRVRGKPPEWEKQCDPLLILT